MTQFDTTDDYDPDTTDDTTDDDGSGLVGKLRRELKAANKRAKNAEDEAGQNKDAARRIAFLDAQIPDTPQTKFFREHYTGELSADAIRADATANGFLAAEDHTAEVAELDGQSASMAGGTQPDAPGDMSQFETDVEEAVRSAPRGQEAKAVDEVYKRYQRSAI